MSILLQKFPMIYVDRFKKNNGEDYFVGIANFTIDETEGDFMPILLIEGMGQTVEYNLRSKLDLNGKKLILAAVKSFEILLLNFKNENLEYHVIDIKSQFGFFTSNVVVWDTTAENAVVMSAEVVHKLEK
ncbi:hypothetical protein CSC2_14030 [Clostridium zeae]|uniref:Uncharacterized protein n=1 Tax=Clostridium zeae TaxID=2759022 RepID=A0ABQ1E7W8_9CLOT|nr:hypothetical protein [Clostridium zeae]GFZ30877.1 hypothetical protein CSC2_14030 [Clostridium zeae]